MAIMKKIDGMAEKYLLAIFMITMSILIFVQVVSRYVFGDAITWTEELARYLFIWLIFLSMSVGFKEEKHIGIDIVVDRCPPRVQKVIKQIVFMLIFCLAIGLTYEGFLLIQQMRGFGQTSANLQIPMWLVYLSLPFGFLITTIRLIQVSIRLWTTQGEEGK